MDHAQNLLPRFGKSFQHPSKSELLQLEHYPNVEPFKGPCFPFTASPQAPRLTGESVELSYRSGSTLPVV